MGIFDKDDIDIVKAWNVQLAISLPIPYVWAKKSSIDYASNEAMVHKDVLYLHLVGFDMDAISVSIINRLSVLNEGEGTAESFEVAF